MARTKRVARHCLSQKQEKRLRARGLGVSDAVQIAKLYKCTMEELLSMYKCRKSMIQQPIAKAKLWLRRHRSGETDETDEEDTRPALVYYDISSYLETWVPYTGFSKWNVVLVMDKHDRTYSILMEHCHKIERLHPNGYKYPDAKINGVMLTASAALQHGDNLITKGSRVSVMGSNVCGVEIR